MNGIETDVFETDVVAQHRLEAFLVDGNKTFRQLAKFQKAPRLNALSDFVTFTTSLPEAVAGADLIQENVPENLLLKMDILSNID